MPIGLIVLGTLLLVAGYNNTQNELFDIVEKTYQNSKGLLYWVLLCIILGFLSTVGNLKEVVNAFLLLMCLVLALTVGSK